MKNIINLIVADEEKGQRIDSFITIKENSLSRTRVKNLILKKKGYFETYIYQNFLMVEIEKLTGETKKHMIKEICIMVMF